MLELVFQVIAVVAAALAAWLWLQSTRVPVPSSLGVSTFQDSNALAGDNDEKRWAREISEKNRRAAIATAVSVGSQGLAILSSLMAANEIMLQ